MLDLKKLFQEKRRNFIERNDDIRMRISKPRERGPIDQRQIEVMKASLLQKALTDRELGKIDEKEFQKIRDDIYQRQFDLEAPALLLRGLHDELRSLEDQEHAFVLSIGESVDRYLTLKSKFDALHKPEFLNLAKQLSKALAVDVVKGDAEPFLKQHGKP